MGIAVARALYDWAIKRSGREEAVRHKFTKLSQWQEGTKNPTFKQLEDFAKYTYTPIGCFFSDAPPDERLPISDFRTFENKEIKNISANVLETIYDCQLKQAWYEEYCLTNKEDKNTFVGSFTLTHSVEAAATAITNKFFSKSTQYKSWDEAFRARKECIEAQGILVMTSGIVLGNTNRSLDLEEFRGFALSNDYAPLIFINAKDTIAARNFTLIHELAHIALGESGISNDRYNHRVEQWCNAVAGEVLVPKAELAKDYEFDNIDTALEDLAKKYKVSTLVILRRLRDTSLLDISDKEYWDVYENEKAKALTHAKSSTGGNFYNTTPARLGKRFLKALAISTLEGTTLYRDAMRFVHVKNMKSFQALIDRVRKHPL